LNAFDCGRFVQQSYYGADDGSDWNGKPWRWNPVQGGSWQNRPARVLECAKVEHNRLRTAVVPRNWAGQELCEDVVMRAEITLQNDHIHLEHTFEYSGTAPHPPRIQELPAVFVARRLSQRAPFGWLGGEGRAPRRAWRRLAFASHNPTCTQPTHPTTIHSQQTNKPQSCFTRATRRGRAAR
jgi:hypothetical protein